MNRIHIFIIIGLASVAIIPILASNTIVDNTSISTTTVNAVNVVASNNINTTNLRVTGTCTGCGSGGGSGGSGTFTSWTTVVLDGTVADGGNTVNDVQIDDDGNLIFNTSGSNPTSWFARANGTTSSYLANTFSSVGNHFISQTSDGKYQAIYDESAHKIHISKNGTAIYDIVLDFATKYNAGNNAAVAISPSGKYIGFADDNFANHALTRYQTFRGS